MFVKMLTVSAGPTGCIPAGTIREVTDAEGKAIIEGLFGTRVEKPARKISLPEAAAIQPPETAAFGPGARRILARKPE